VNKKIVGIIGLVCVIAVAVFLFAGKKENNVDTGTTSIETVVEQENPDINDVLPDTELDITIEDVESNEEGVSEEAEVVDEETGTSESIVETETTAPDEETAKEDTTATPVESTEVQEVYSADQAPTTSHEETVQQLEEAGIDIEVEDTTQMTPEEVAEHNQKVMDSIWGNAIVGPNGTGDGLDTNGVTITIE